MSKNPCSECPFRRKGAAGWLGPHPTSMDIIQIIRQDQKFPCHTQVNRIQAHLLEEFNDDSDDCLEMSDSAAYSDAVRQADHCVGALAFMNNSAKRSRDPRILAEQQCVGKRTDVFATAAEMTAFHRK